MKLTVREKNLIIVAVTVIVFALITTYLIVPARERYATAKLNLEQASGQVSKINNARKAKKVSQRDLKNMTVQLSVYRDQLPIRAESPELLLYLNQAAIRSGLVLEKFESLGSKSSEPSEDDNKSRTEKSDDTPGKIAALTYKIRVMGNYKQVRAFLAETEGLIRIIHNKSITLNENRLFKNLECLIEFDAFVMNNGVGEIKTGKTVESINNKERNSLFAY